MLIIDEIHHLLAGETRRQDAFRNVIKTLGNELEISIVAAGTKEAFNAIRVDEQLSNRFRPFALPRWEYNLNYRRFLVSYEQFLPLRKRSDLSEERLSQKILGMAGGTVGEIADLLRSASVEAINSREEKISPQLLDRLEWVRNVDRTEAQMKKL
jgi:hypothetical protein